MFENAGNPPQLTSTAGELTLDRQDDGAVPLGELERAQQWPAA